MYNLTKFCQNRMKNKKVLLGAYFFVNKQLKLLLNYLKKYISDFYPKKMRYNIRDQAYVLPIIYVPIEFLLIM